jgi:hypothetical protein
MMKKILIVLLVLSGFLKAEVVNKIIVVVNDEPITSYDLKTAMHKTKLAKSAAIEYLISEALINSEIKKRNIVVDNYEVDSRLELIAKQNGITLYKLKQYLLSNGTLDDFIEKINKDLQKQKLFDALSYSKISIDEKDIKEYYESHISDFTQFNIASVTKYTSLTAKDLETITKNPLANVVVKTEQLTLESQKLPFTLMKLIDDTKKGTFTKILRDTSGYVMFFVNKKEGKYVMPLEKVKNSIANIIASSERDRIIKNYFQKEKSKAVIKRFD